MKQLFKIITFVLITGMLITCKENEVYKRPYPRLKTLPVIVGKNGGVTFQAEITMREEHELVSYGFTWIRRGDGQTVYPPQKIIYNGNIDANLFSSTITSDLVHGKIYFVSAYVITEDYTVSGDVVPFVSNGELQPLIQDVSPLFVNFGSEITIKGENFDTVPGHVQLFFKGAFGTKTEVEITSISSKSIIALVPEDLYSKVNYVLLEMNNSAAQSKQKITILDPVIHSFSPKSVKTSQQISITGENFSSIIGNNKVLIDGVPANIITASNNNLIIKTPSQSDHIYRERDVDVSVEVFSTGTVAKDKLSLTDKWFRLNELPFYGRCQGGLIINNRVYVLNSGKLWEYNPENTEWVEKVSFPDIQRDRPAMFTVSDRIYVGTGWSSKMQRNENDIWEYNIELNKWTQKSDFPGNPRSRAMAFSIENYGYMGAGYNSMDTIDFWQYNAEIDSWTRIADYPLRKPVMYGAVSAVLNNEVYIGLGAFEKEGDFTQQIFKYNPAQDKWFDIGVYPTESTYNHSEGTAFTLNGQIYFGSGHRARLWSYNGLDWTAQEFNNAGRNGGFSFVMDNIGYFGAGETGSQFWTFDPSQLN